MKEYYDLFECNETISLESVHLKYKELAKKFHPDLNGGKTTKEFQKLQEAYEWLKRFHKQKVGTTNTYKFFRMFEEQENITFYFPKGFNDKDVLVKCKSDIHGYFNVYLKKEQIQDLPYTIRLTNLKRPLQVTIREER